MNTKCFRSSPSRRLVVALNVLTFAALLVGLPGLQAQVTSGLLAWYKLDGNALDSSGNGHNGTPSGCVATNGHAGMASGAMYFNGSSNYIDILNLDSYSTLSLAAWVRPEAGGANSQMAVISGDNGKFDRALVLGSDGSLQVFAGTQPTNLSVSVPFDSWSHLVLIYSTNNIQLYTNGTLAWQRGSPAADWGEGGWCLGNSAGGIANPMHLKGALDDVRVYTNVLSPSSISVLAGKIAGGWSLAPSSLLNPVHQCDLVETNGYLYLVGGSNSVGSVSDAYYAKVNENGSLQAWQATTPLPEADHAPGIVIYSNRIYAALQNFHIYSAPIAADGSLGGWRSEGTGPGTGYHRMGGKVNGNRWYLVGGGTGPGLTPQLDVWTAVFNPDGTLNNGLWKPNVHLPIALKAHTIHFFNGRLYVIGGYSTGPTNTVYWADVVPSGISGSWKAQDTRLPQPLWQHSSALVDGNIFVLGGLTNASGINPNVYKGTINADGSITNWVLVGGAPSSYGIAPGLAYVATSGPIYLAGGCNGSDYATNVWVARPELIDFSVWISGRTVYSGGQTGLLCAVATNLFGAEARGSPTPGTNFAIWYLALGEQYWVSAFLDSNTNGVRDPWEANGTYANNPVFLTNVLADIEITLTDPYTGTGDYGVPDWWCVQYGVTQNNVTTTPPGDRLTYFQKYHYRLNPLTNDTDGDLLTDYDELFVYHSDPSLVHSDNDGVDDGAEVAAGRDPVRTGNKFHYDKNDRLIGAEYEKGLSLGYQYDGNGNIVRQVYLAPDGNTNALPDVWEFINGLTNSAGAYSDSDGDDWSDYQELMAGTLPLNTNSKPDVSGLPGTNIVSIAWPFTPTNFVVGVGQLDGGGAEKIVIGADGDPGTNTNFLLVLTETNGGWSAEQIPVGKVGITALAIGKANSNNPAAIYAGTRQTGGTGTVVEIKPVGGFWQTNVLSIGSTGEVAYVLGVSTNYGVFAQFSSATNGARSLFNIAFLNGVCAPSVIDPQSAQVGQGISSGDRICRVIDSETIRVVGELGRAVDIHAQGQCVRVPPASMNGLSYGTIEAWIWLRQNTNATITAKQRDSKDSMALFTVGYWVGAGGASGYGIPGALYFHAKNTNYYAVSASRISTGVWTHVAVAFSTTFAKIYVNGTLDRTTSGDYSVPSDSDSADTLGAWINSGNGTWMMPPSDMCLDEVRIWNRVLYDAEILASSQTTLNGNEADLRAWWSFDNDTAQDGSMNHYNGTLEGGPQFLTRSMSTATISPPSPVGTTLLWRGPSLAWGSPRQGTDVSLFFASVDDVNENGIVDALDEFVVGEYLAVGRSYQAITPTRRSVGSSASQSYGLACLNYRNSIDETFFTAEPDGQVFSWVATDAPGRLQRQLFSTQHTGKTWHALAGVKTLEPGEALVGLRVDPANQDACDVILWPALSLPTGVPQTAPVTSLLTDPSRGNGLATNSVTLWDAEGNASLIEMQFQLAGSTTWTDITAMVGVDGNRYGAVSTHPTGVTHQVVWNAAQVFGAGYTNNLNMRARATDVSLTGNWSPAIPFRVEISVGNPMATNDAANTPEDVPVNINVLANDSVQPPAAGQVASVSQPVHGTAVINADWTIRYTPATNWPSSGSPGTDSFVYTLADGAGGMSMAEVTVTVVPVNDPPEAGPFSFDTTEDTAFTLQWNPALDAEGDTVTLCGAAATSTNGGTIVVAVDRLTYTPPLNFNGTDTFNYTVIDDGKTDGTNDFKTATGTVTVAVTAVNDAPVITVPGPGPLALPEDSAVVLTNVSVADVDAGSGQLLATLSATNGTLFLSSTNGLTFSTGGSGASSMTFTAALGALNAALTNLTYLPLTNFNGADQITLSVNDQGNTGTGGALSDTKLILITVNAVNDVPFVTLTNPVNGAVFIAPATITLAASASDVDGQVVKVEFFQGTNLLSSALTNPPYQFTWSNVSAGVYNLFASATDDLGATNVSSLVTITNRQSGFVKLESPEAGGGSFSMLITGEAGQVYNVLMSSNLNDWATVGTVTNVTGSVLYTEPVPTSETQRYYRAKVAE